MFEVEFTVDPSMRVSITRDTTPPVFGMGVIVAKATSFKQKGYWFTPQFKKGRWDGFIRFQDSSGSFPVGMLSDVRNAILRQAKKLGVLVTVHIKDTSRFIPIRKKFYATMFSTLTLRDYQLEAIRIFLEKRRGILKVATNGGKTAIAAGIIKSLDCKTLFIVTGKDLLYQTSSDLRDLLGVDVGLIGDNKWDPKEITVGIINTFNSFIFSSDDKKRTKCIKFLETIDLVIADECHKYGAKPTYAVLERCPAPCRLAMSGTPLDRTDGADMRLLAQVGPIFYEVSNAALITKGVSLPVKIKLFEVAGPQLDESGVYQDIYEEGIVNNKQRNLLIASKVKEFIDAGLGVLVSVVRVEHGRVIEKLLPSGICEFVYGEDTMERRTDALESFRNEKLKVIVSTNIFHTGINLANIDVIVIADGGKSKISKLQLIGRGLRIGGKLGYLLVIDFLDLCHPYLSGHTIERVKHYEAEKVFDIELYQQGESNPCQIS